MADDADNTDKRGGTATRSRAHRTPVRMRMPGAALRRRTVAAIATVISVITTVVVAVLAVHIVFVAFEANAGNEIVSTVRDWADDLAWQFKDIFQPSNAKARVAVNYGLAALVYLLIGRALVALVRRLGR